MINLCLVVIATQFSETKKRETERMRLERARFQSSSTLASGSEPTGCYEEITKYIAHLWRGVKRKVRRFYRTTKFAKTRRRNAIALRRQQFQNVVDCYDSSCEVPNLEQTDELDAGRTLTSDSDSHKRECHADSPLVPHASPEVSDIDLSSPKRSPVVGCSPVNDGAGVSASTTVPNSSGLALQQTTNNQEGEIFNMYLHYRLHV